MTTDNNTNNAFSFSLTCQKCNDEDTMHVSLADTETFYCSGCGEETTREEIVELIGEWSKALRWLDHANSFKMED